MVVSKYVMGTGMGDTVPRTGVADCEGCVDSVETPAAAAPAGVPRTPGGSFDLELVEVERAWNIEESEILEKIRRLMAAYPDPRYVTTYYRDTWGSCRVTKFILLEENGAYIPGKWFDRSSRRNVHAYWVIEKSEFAKRYAGKVLVASAFVQPSCNASRRYSFRAKVRVVVPHG